MDVREIPFVKLVDIQKQDNSLSLSMRIEIENHIKTMHAGAQFTLAETQSGQFLQETFNELEGQVVPILRDASIKKNGNNLSL